MRLNCRKCQASIESADINLDARLALCPSCSALWRLSAPEQPDRLLRLFRQDATKRHYRFDAKSGDFTVIWPLRPAGKKGFAIMAFLVAFTAVWWAIILGAMLPSFSDKEGFGPGGIVFALPFMLAGCAMILAILVLLFGKGSLKIAYPHARVRWSFWSLGLGFRGTLNEGSVCRWATGEFVRAGRTTAREGRTPTGMTITTTEGKLSFGSAIPPDQRRDLAGAVNDYLDAVSVTEGTQIIARSEPLRQVICPHCGGAIGRGAVDVQALEFACPHCGEASDLLLETARTADLSKEEEPLKPVERPAGTKIVINYPDEGRMAVYLPPHGFKGPAAFLLMFSIFWLAISLTIAGAFLFGALSEKSTEVFLACLFAALFPMVGFVMLYFAVRFAREKKFLLIDPERIVLRRQFLGRTRDKERPRAPEERADLVVSYEQNDVPVYKIKLQQAQLSFGSELDREEKEWLAWEINRFLAAAL